jgi:hypothetical protein
MDMPGATGAADVHGDNHDELSAQGNLVDGQRLDH